MTTAAADALRRARRVVVKVGSALLIAADGGPDRERIKAFADGLAALKASAQEPLLVTSGAIGLGRRRLGLKGARELRIEEKQAASAAGQALLINVWQEALEPHGVVAAQTLLTLGDTTDRRRFLNARATMRTLIEIGALPIVNENDTVATAEIRYGDNDRLAAHAAQLAGADLLLILSDVDGVYERDPRDDPDAAHIPVIDAVTPAIERAAGGPNAAAGLGAGGMATKLAAAKIAAAAGCATIIASGRAGAPIDALLAGAPATLIQAHTNPARARKTWIAGLLNPAGVVTIDAGAAAALADGASLLPAGVVRVDGAFSRGDLVLVRREDGLSLGQGIVKLDAEDAKAAAGKSALRAQNAGGAKRRPALIDRDDLVLSPTAT